MASHRGSMWDQLRKEYQSYSTPQLVQIAKSRAGEYRPEAVEAAKAELANRGEDWQTSRYGAMDADPPEQDGNHGIKGKFLLLIYVLCWVMVCRFAIEIAMSFILAEPVEKAAVLKSSDIAANVVLMLALFVAAWGLHIRVFGKPMIGRGRDPLTRILVWIDKLRPAPMPSSRKR